MTQFNGDQYQSQNDCSPGGKPLSDRVSDDNQKFKAGDTAHVPFIPYFGWKPGMEDFPVTLLPPASVLQAPVADTFSPEHAWMKNVEVLAAPQPKRRKMPAALTATVLASALAGGIYWTQIRDTGTTETVPQAEQPPPSTPAASFSNPTNSPDPSGAGGGLPGDLDQAGNPDSDGATIPNAVEDPTSTAERITPTATDSIRSTITTVIAIEGDTLEKVANRTDTDIASLVWSNPSYGPTEVLETGTTVLIPDSGTLIHTVVMNETHESIAAAYGVNVSDLYDTNGEALSISGDLIIGDTVIVDSAERLDRGSLDYYTVATGDNLWTIASYYGLQPQTLAWANELPRPELIHPDQELIIPPGDGALVKAEAGDSVESLVEPFEADYDSVTDYAFNDLGDDSVLLEGQWVLVPGDLFAPLASGPTELSASSVAGEDVVGPATGEFIWPTDGIVTQEFGGRHTGLDIANEEWTPINATDGGIVIFAGWNDYGLGYAVGIDHGNGYVTWYGHMAQQPYVEVGQVIWQGGYIGPMGTTGNSTGPHLHFVVMEEGVYQNPLQLIQ